MSKRQRPSSSKPEEASTHKSAKTLAGNVHVTHDLGLWPFDIKINEFPGLIIEHFFVPASVFEILWVKQTDTQTNGKNSTPCDFHRRGCSNTAQGLYAVSQKLHILNFSPPWPIYANRFWKKFQLSPRGPRDALCQLKSCQVLYD